MSEIALSDKVEERREDVDRKKDEKKRREDSDLGAGQPGDRRRHGQRVNHVAKRRVREGETVTVCVLRRDADHVQEADFTHESVHCSLSSPLFECQSRLLSVSPPESAAATAYHQVKFKGELVTMVYQTFSC